MQVMFQSTCSACHGNEVSDNAAPSTTPPPPEVEIDALWTVAMLHPIVYMDSEIGSSVDTIWAGLCDEEGVGGMDCHIGEQVSFTCDNHINTISIDS